MKPWNKNNPAVSNRTGRVNLIARSVISKRTGPIFFSRPWTMEGGEAKPAGPWAGYLAIGRSNQRPVNPELAAAVRAGERAAGPAGAVGRPAATGPSGFACGRAAIW